MGILIFLFLLAAVAWAAFTQIAARQQVSVSFPYGVTTARGLVSGPFGVGWTAVPGRGDDNFKPKMRVRAPVLSVSYRAGGSGGCEVDIWCSAFVTRYGLIHHAQLMWRKRRAVARILTQPAQLSSPQLAGAAASDTTQLNLQGAARIPAEAPRESAAAHLNGRKLEDAAWLRSGEDRYRSMISNHYGSPDTIAAGGEKRAQCDDLAAALFFYQKAIDTLHSIYVCGLNDSGPASWSRQPSARDHSILDNYLSTLRTVRQIHPGAPVGSSVTEVTHRMRTISSQFRRHKLDPAPYLDRLSALARIAPEVDVSKVFWR
jgi:hypothetical protein